MQSNEPIPSEPRVVALLVTHDGARWLPEVLTSLQAQERMPDRILAIDTGSIDRTKELLWGSEVEIFNVHRDCGFAEAINRGISAVSESEPLVDYRGAQTWFWLLHDDFAPAPDALARLLTAVAADPSVAIAGPKLRGWHDRNHLLEVGISIAGNGARWTGLERHERDQGQHDGIREVLSVSTAGMLVRADAFDELGGFDPHLSLFRDDVDFGWRAHMAGHRVICVTDAVGLHAEAAATERRMIDVDGAVLHRPHLLDRRNANYVLLANCSRLRYIPALLRLVLSTALRALGYIAAKLPGYAADETAALVLVLSRPDLIRHARKSRKMTRLLPASSVNRFFAPNGELIRSAFDGLRALIMRGKAPIASPSTSFEDARISVASDDEEDAFADQGRSVVRKILFKPVIAMTLILTLLALITGRNRLGALAGGSLLPAPNGAGDFLTSYLDSWHSVSLGSTIASPPWLPILAFLGAGVGGRAPLLLVLLFLFAIPASAAAMYALMRKVTSERWLRVFASVLYALSPAVVTGVVDGHISIVVIGWLLPLVLLVARPLMRIEQASWRRIFGVGLLLSIIIAFAPVLMLLLVLTLAFALLIAFRDGGRESLKTQAIRVAPLFLTPLALLFPWSLSALIHPTMWIQDPGLQIKGGGALGMIFLAPGGPSAPPFWFGTGLTALLLITLGIAVNKYQVRYLLLVALSVLALAVPLTMIHFSSHGTAQLAPPWLGAISLFVTIVLLAAGVLTTNGFADQLAERGVGREHAGTLVMAVLLVLATLTMTVWLIGPGANSAVSAGRNSVVPAFIQEASKGDEHPRTLILTTQSGKSRYTIIRDRTLELGDADVLHSDPPALKMTIANLIAGGNEKTSVELGQFAIRYILLTAPLDQSLIRVLDGVSGLSQVSSTSDGVLWKVAGVTSRVRFIGTDGKQVALPSDRIAAKLTVTQPGRIVIADRGDPGWRAIQHGTQLLRSYAYGWATSFGVTKPGDVFIVHDSTRRRTGVSLQFLAWLAVLIFIAPGGRRRIDRPDEEVA